MKIEITAQQLVHFRQNGHIRFEQFSFEHIESPLEKCDLWRTRPTLKKMILRSLGPLALELTGKSSLRLACDQWLDDPYPVCPLRELFCFQGLAAIIALKESALDIYEPTSLSSLLSYSSYLVAFGCDPVRFMDNPRDPHLSSLKKMGYAFGDPLKTEFHPLIFRQ